MANRIDSSNNSAFLYATNVSTQIEKICVPLKHLNIKNFGYVKMFKDSTYLYLTNGLLKFQKKYFENIKDQGKVFSKKTTNLYIKDNYNYFIWPTEILSDPILSLFYSHNIWHGLELCYKHYDFVEIFYFAFDCGCDDQTNFFMNNKDILCKFCDLFKLEAKDIIDCSDKSKLAIFKNGLNSQMFTNPSSKKQNREKNFLCGLNSQQNIAPTKSIQFSNQENNCIKLLAQGRTMKEIGRALNISPRTVESYIANVKNKTGYNFKSQIIDLFIKNQSILSHG